ncbi:MAG TPA: hypothetical protein VGS19_10570 [Streptosporangiaceae bacterium]|nr:hypothetical protein [Streptosporangiaceae bacterium]
MTNPAQAQATDSAAAVPAGRKKLRVARYTAGALAAAATLPYLALKIAWLSGSSVGVANRAVLRSASLAALNALTAGMNIVAIALVLVFTLRWGGRVPGWLVLLPMWVGAGFLAPIGLLGPVDALYSAVSGTGVVPARSLVDPWVYHLVYTGFAGEAVFLLAAFALYAVDRWPGALSGPRAGHGTPRPWPQAALALVAAVLATAAGLAYLAWAFGATAGLPGNEAEEGFSGHMTQAGFGVMALLGAAGIIMLARADGMWTGRQRRQRPAAVLMTWVGTGSMFAWGSWATLNTLGQTPLSQAGATGAGVASLVGLAEMLAGLLGGVLLSCWLAESTTRQDELN